MVPRVFPVPRYGTRSLGEVVPSLLSAVGLAGFANALGLERCRRVCLLLIDGLGWELLRGNRAARQPPQASFARFAISSGAMSSTCVATYQL